jgi:hypothetical protein
MQLDIKSQIQGFIKCKGTKLRVQGDEDMENANRENVTYIESRARGPRFVCYPLYSLYTPPHHSLHNQLPPLCT